MSVFDEQPPIINVSSFPKWLKENYAFFKSKDIKLSRLNSERDINLLNLKTGITDEDGYEKKPYEQYSPDQSVEEPT